MMATTQHETFSLQQHQQEPFGESWLALQRATMVKHKQDLAEARMRHYEGNNDGLSGGDARFAVHMLVAEAARQDLARVRMLSAAIRNLVHVSQDAGFLQSDSNFGATTPPFALPIAKKYWERLMSTVAAPTGRGDHLLPGESPSLEQPLLNNAGSTSVTKLSWSGFVSLQFAQQVLYAVKSSSRTAIAKENHGLDEPYLHAVGTLMNGVCCALPSVDTIGKRARSCSQIVDFINAPFDAALKVVHQLTKDLLTDGPPKLSSQKPSTVQSLVLALGRMISLSTVEPSTTTSTVGTGRRGQRRCSTLGISTSA